MCTDLDNAYINPGCTIAFAASHSRQSLYSGVTLNDICSHLSIRLKHVCSNRHWYGEAVCVYVGMSQQQC